MRILNIALAVKVAFQLTLVRGITPLPRWQLFGPIREGATDVVARMIREGHDVNEGLPDGWTPLHEAARQGNLNVVDLLLVNGANPLATRPGGILTPILVAARHGPLTIVERLLENQDVSTYLLGNILIFGATGGRLDVVEYVLQRDRSLANVKNIAGFTLLDLVPEPRGLMIIRLSSDTDSAFALRMASLRGFIHVVSTLVQYGAKIDHYALAGACRGGHVDVINYLIDLGADVNHPDYPIAAAAESGKVEIVELLIQRGATRGFDEALLTSPCRRDFVLTKLLLGKGADPNAATESQVTRLFYAVEDNRPDLVRLLLDHGADLRPDVEGRSPLVRAMGPHRITILNSFVEAGFVKDLEIPANLHNKPGVMRRLLLSGAKTTVVSAAVYRELMRPIAIIKTAVRGSDLLHAFHQVNAELSAMGHSVDRSLVSFAFAARKEGIDLFSNSQVRRNMHVNGWTNEKIEMLSSIIGELVYLECTDLNFFYTVAPFLATADEDMLKHAETAFKFLSGALAGMPQTNMDEKENYRPVNSAILNEMIERSNHIGFRPVVKALFTIYHEEWKNLATLRLTGLPNTLSGLVMNYDHGPFNPNFKEKAMLKLTQAIRRLQ